MHRRGFFGMLAAAAAALGLGTAAKAAARTEKVAVCRVAWKRNGVVIWTGGKSISYEVPGVTYPGGEFATVVGYEFPGVPRDTPS